MASSEDKNFKRSLDSTWSRGQSKAQMSVGKILDTISTAAAPPNSQPNLHQDEGLDGESFVGRKVEKKRGLLNIDLNVAPPEDGGSKSPVAKSGGNGQEIRPTAVADVASNVSEKKVGSADEQDLNFSGNIAEVIDEVHPGNCENRNGIQTHWSKGETNGFGVLEDEAKQMETTNIIADLEVEKDEKDRGNRGWITLLDVAENALSEHEESLRNKEEINQNRKRKTSREVELGGGLHKATTRKKITGPRRQSLVAEWNGEGEGEVAAAEVLASPVVVRSTRGRALALPNKYRDSVLDAVAVAEAEAEAELPQHNKSGKSATVVSTKRKSR